MSASVDVVFPNILWAQRPEHVFLSIQLQDAADVTIEIQKGRELRFAATAGGQRYGCVVEFFREVSTEESGHVVLPRQVELRLKKRPPSDNFDEEERSVCRVWPRLTRDKAKSPHIQVDWSRWRDDDDSAGDSEDDQNGIGFDYEKLMSQLIAQKTNGDEAELLPGDDSCGEDDKNSNDADDNFYCGSGKTKTNKNNDNDYDDLPPLEE